MTDERLTAIESKMDYMIRLLARLLDALVDEPETVVMDGSVQSAERDQSQPL